MANNIKIVDAINQEMRKGWPYGAADAYKAMPALFKRISDLEAVLAPLAGVAYANKDVPPDNGLQHVRWEDLVNAYNMMDIGNSYAAKREEFFDYPAE